MARGKEKSEKLPLEETEEESEWSEEEEEHLKWMDPYGRGSGSGPQHYPR